MTLEGNACTVAILAGGMGTRLKSRTGAIPKPMAPVCGKPVLEHLINLCATHGFLSIALLVHHEHQVISDYFGDGSSWGVRLTYCIEQEARGTAGALNDALPVLAERFLVLYGDTYADVDLNRIWSSHHTRKADATLFLHPNDHPADSDIVELDADGTVTAIHPYPHEPSLVFRNLVNAALYVFERAALVGSLPTTGKADIAKHTLNALLAKDSRVVGYVSPEYIKDMGTPDRLDKVERDVREGMAARLSGRGPRSAIFLDRDGTINVEVNHLSSPDQLTLIPGAGEAIRAINRSGALAVVVTNQPVLARGDVDWRGMDAIHAQLDMLLGEKGAYIDQLYMCPHHPDTGFEGEVPSLKKICECRKPASGLIEQAVADLGIEIQQSWMIGDSTADIVAGNNIGLQTILVETGNAGNDRKYLCKPDFVVRDIKAAVSWILEGRDKIATQMLPIVDEIGVPRLIVIGGKPGMETASAAKVMAQLYKQVGRTSHVVSLDRWVRARVQALGVTEVGDEFDQHGFHADVLNKISSKDDFVISVRGYAAELGEEPAIEQWEIATTDVIIFEGSFMHIDESMMDKASTVVLIDLITNKCVEIYNSEYNTGAPVENISSALISDELNFEEAYVRFKTVFANYIVTSEQFL